MFIIMRPDKWKPRFCRLNTDVSVDLILTVCHFSDVVEPQRFSIKRHPDQSENRPFLNHDLKAFRDEEFCNAQSYLNLTRAFVILRQDRDYEDFPQSS